ncbi:hypothetical protein ACS0TY_001561 [Phlomoides rotata]
MGKEGELWDDSALIKAFDHAFSKYKVMHGMTQEKSINENFPADNGSNEVFSSTDHVQNMDNPYSAVETTTKTGETSEIIQSKEELGSSKFVGSSNIQDGNVIPTNEIPTSKSDSPGKYMISSDIKTQNEAITCSNSPEEYSMLLNKYYEVEGQRQQILQQLYQYNNCNEQFPISSTPTAEEYQASVAQPYDTVTCHCPYGCQNWVVPCNSLPTSCLGGNYVDKCCQDIPKGSQNGNSMSPEDPDFVKTAMVAAERALLLTKEANGGKMPIQVSTHLETVTLWGCQLGSLG